MLERYRWRCCLLLLILLLPVAAMAADDCRHLTATGNPEYPPYLWRDPDNPALLIGANVDLLQHVARQLGIDIAVVYSGPWSRAQEQVRNGRIDLLAGLFITQTREQTMDFIKPAFLSTDSMVWVRRDDGFAYVKWDDLKGRSGGTLVNNSHGQAFDDFASANLNLEAVPSAHQAFEKLLHKRNDYVLFERYPGMALARTLGVEHKLQMLEPPVSAEGLYLAVSHNAPCNVAELRQRLAASMQEVTAGPLPAQWVMHNLQRWRSQNEPGTLPGKP